MNIQYFFIIFTLCYSCHSSKPGKCDKSQCTGPIKFYKSLNCKPVYKTPESCCPYKYNCDHLYDRSPNKCYINGREYKIGDNLKDEDAAPCDIGCTCSRHRGVPEFVCAIVDCFDTDRMIPGCYKKRAAHSCCPGEIVCPESPEDRATCLVDGKIYKDGEHYEVASDPELNCYCLPGYKGENVEPFCKSKKKLCQPELRHAHDIVNRCAPVFRIGESPQTDCSFQYRCQKSNDEVIPSKDKQASTRNHDVKCLFGDKVMGYGDELDRRGSDCMKCVCEVGPMLTCKQLPANECNIKHSPSL